MDPRDYILDIAGLRDPHSGAGAPPGAGGTAGGAGVSGGTSGAGGTSGGRASGTSGTSGGGGRPWIAIHWKCCHTYSRLYRNAAGTAYEGQCPKCGAKTRAGIGSGGTNQRFFTAE